MKNEKKTNGIVFLKIKQSRLPKRKIDKSNVKFVLLRHSVDDNGVFCGSFDTLKDARKGARKAIADMNETNGKTGETEDEDEEQVWITNEKRKVFILTDKETAENNSFEDIWNDGDEFECMFQIKKHNPGTTYN